MTERRKKELVKGFALSTSFYTLTVLVPVRVKLDASRSGSLVCMRRKEESEMNEDEVSRYKNICFCGSFGSFTSLGRGSKNCLVVMMRVWLFCFTMLCALSGCTGGRLPKKLDESEAI
ncbi:hypothetical protein P389DRAFT_96941 [Cystobasidium minutum MCA 4210]|uniref:uncharacterized protein n=1 Tax=Cystobasidium minutum MCA 4210 TaxID=1397322 RepID=UPI0034CDAE86|eukprot:jgi/Rhomi1/96941/CE96940_247